MHAPPHEFALELEVPAQATLPNLFNFKITCKWIWVSKPYLERGWHKFIYSNETSGEQVMKTIASNQQSSKGSVMTTFVSDLEDLLAETGNMRCATVATPQWLIAAIMTKTIDVAMTPKCAMATMDIADDHVLGAASESYWKMKAPAANVRTTAMSLGEYLEITCNKSQLLKRWQRWTSAMIF